MPGQISSAVEAATYTAAASLFAAIVAATVALVAALLSLASSLVSTRVNKRNAGLQVKVAQQIKHADFRQAWINSLRDSFVEFERCAIQSEPRGPPSAELMASGSKILMMLNRDDEKYTPLKSEIFRVTRNSSKDDRRVYFDEGSTFVALSQDILKGEWRVTKSDLHDVPKYYLQK